MGNNQDDCGCGPKSPKPKSYFMVETSESEASTCEPKSVASGTDGCPIQEPSFDNFETGILVPLHGSNIDVRVCNGSVYSVGQWIQTLSSPITTLRIGAINDNNLTLINGCPNGAEIDDNAPGVTLNAGTRFTVVGEPDCLTDAQKAQLITGALSDSTQVCVPSMVESDPNAVMQVVGRVESNPDDTSFGKCLRRIAGFLMNAGTPILSAISTEPDSARMSNRRLVINKTNRRVKEIPNHSENPALQAGKQYGIAVTSSKEYPIGPVYFPSLFETKKLLIQAPADINSASSGWPLLNSSGEFTQTFSLNIAEITSLLRDQDHYYAMCRIMISSIAGGSGVNLTSYLNDVIASQAVSYEDSSTLVWSKNSVSIPIKVLVSDHSLALKLKSSSAAASRYWVRLEVDGVFI